MFKYRKYRKYIKLFSKYLIFFIVLSFSESGTVKAKDLNTSYKKQSHIEHNGVTFYFDKPYLVGQFVNNDWWVKGPVTIIKITPDSESGRNGWEINPKKSNSQTYDSRGAYYDNSRLLSLPYTSRSNESVIKSISKSKDYRCKKSKSKCRSLLTDAIVLTVLTKIPPVNSKKYFRPPYFGSEKPLIHIDTVNFDIIPILKGFKIRDKRIQIEEIFKNVQLDHLGGWKGAFFHPINNIPNYGADIAINTGIGAIAMLQDITIELKRQFTYLYIQSGLDWFYMIKNGRLWRSDGGHSSGRKLPIIISAILLENKEMKNFIKSKNKNEFGEDGQVYISKINKKILWGQNCTEATYWRMKIKYGNGRSCRDPYELIDGPEGQGYQFCCTSKAWKSAALIGNLWPEVKFLWNNSNYFSYVDRWVNYGAITSDDTCSNSRPKILNGKCITGNGRRVENDNKFADQGYYSHKLIDSAWKRYRFYNN